MMPTRSSVLLAVSLAGCAIPHAEPIDATRVSIVAGSDGSIVLAVPECPNWQRNSREDFSNRNASNFGCADALNLIGQLSEPSDLVRGRPTGNQDGRAAAGAVERYRARKTAPLSTSGPDGEGGAPAGSPS